MAMLNNKMVHIYIYIYFYPSRNTRHSMFLAHAAVLVITIGCSHRIWMTTHGHAHRQKIMPTGNRERLCRSRKLKASTQKPKGEGWVGSLNGLEWKRIETNVHQHFMLAGLVLFYPSRNTRHSMFLAHAAVLVITIGCSHRIWMTTHGHAHRQKIMPTGNRERLCRSRKLKASTQKPDPNRAQTMPLAKLPEMGPSSRRRLKGMGNGRGQSQL